MAGIVWIRARLPDELKGVAPVYKLRMWMSTALPAVVGNSARLLMNRSDILMLAPLATMLEVGYYGAAMKVTYLQSAPVIVLSTVITARISEAIAAGKIRQGKRLFFGSLAFALICSVPVAALLSVFAEPIMTLLFGMDYAQGSQVLAILSVAQVGAAINIPVTSFMLMTGRQNTFGKMTLVALIANITGNWLLIPELGAEGAALATMISILLLTFMQSIACISIMLSGRYSEKEAR